MYCCSLKDESSNKSCLSSNVFFAPEKTYHRIIDVIRLISAGKQKKKKKKKKKNMLSITEACEPAYKVSSYM